jgi:hypothetical protein
MRAELTGGEAQLRVAPHSNHALPATTDHESGDRCAVLERLASLPEIRSIQDPLPVEDLDQVEASVNSGIDERCLEEPVLVDVVERVDVTSGSSSGGVRCSGCSA